MGPELASYFNLDGGVLVIAAPEETEQAGFQGGDVILSVNGTAIGNAGEVYQALHSPDNDSPISVEVLRHGVQQVLEIGPENMGMRRPHSISIRSSRAVPVIPATPPEPL